MKKIAALLAGIFISASLFAQSADRITEIISSKKGSYGQTAYLAACALGVIEDNSTLEYALEYFQDKGIVAKNVTVDDTINLKNLSWFCYQAWNVEGGLMLKLTKKPRYAFRQLKADEILAFSDDPTDIPDGHKLLAVITDCISTYRPRNEGDN